MNWIFSSLIMFFGSVTLYLLLRKSSLSKNTVQFNNLGMFLIPLAIYTAIAIFQSKSFNISHLDLLVIFLSAFVFSYLGNASSLKAVEIAPNPGYSLVISKSYVVFTTVISFVFLGGEISASKILAILLIILFSGLVTVDPRKNRTNYNNAWICYTFFSFFAWGLLSLAVKYLATRGVETLIMLIYLYLFVSLFILIEARITKAKVFSGLKSLPMFIGIGTFSSVFNFFNFYSVGIAPNVGYVNAINASSISIVTLLSILFFKDDFSKRKIIGVFGVTLGLLLLILG